MCCGPQVHSSRTAEMSSSVGPTSSMSAVRSCSKRVDSDGLAGESRVHCPSTESSAENMVSGSTRCGMSSGACRAAHEMLIYLQGAETSTHGIASSSGASVWSTPCGGEGLSILEFNLAFGDLHVFPLHAMRLPQIFLRWCSRPLRNQNGSARNQQFSFTVRVFTVTHFAAIRTPWGRRDSKKKNKNTCLLNRFRQFTCALGFEEIQSGRRGITNWSSRPVLSRSVFSR